MKKLQNAVLVPFTDFELIDADSDFKLDKRQIHPMIYYQGCTFKQVKEEYIVSFKNMDPSISTVFACSRQSQGCKCKFVLNNDRNGRLIGTHTPLIEHSFDFYRNERYLFRKHVITCLQETKNMPAFDIINLYLKRNEVTVFTPCRSFMTSIISKIKLEGIGKLPQKFEDLDLLKLREIGDGLIIENFDYIDDSGQQHMLLIYNSWQLQMGTSSCTFMSDSTYKNVPKIFSQMFH